MTDQEPITTDQGGLPRVRLDGPTGSRENPVLVVGHCRTRGSKDVLEVARDLARRMGAVVHVVHAISLDDYPVDPDADDWEAQAAQVLAGQRAEVGDSSHRRGAGMELRRRAGGPGGVARGGGRGARRPDDRGRSARARSSELRRPAMSMPSATAAHTYGRRSRTD